MKAIKTMTRRVETDKLAYGILAITFILLYFTIQAIASDSLPVRKVIFADAADTSIAVSIRSQLKANRTNLYFPHSVQRFYQQNGFKLAWVAPRHR